jgi:cathepsin A (carboxypeptidase C)
LRDEPVEGLCDSSVKSYSGYFNVKSGHDKNYFFWLFESRAQPSTDPLIMWLTGGPGCSSQLALMTENGPCKPTEDGMNTVNNPYSWNTNANIMWVDQPANVGFSYGTKLIDDDRNEEQVAEDMYNFLQEFFRGHPEYSQNAFFVFGESYGGHYAPAIASRIYKGNLNNDGAYINLKGVGVGNGLTDPLIQYQYYPQMAMNNSYGIKTVSEDAYSKMVDRLPTCKRLATACQYNTSLCVPADDYCNFAETTPYYNTGLNPYDIRVPCGENSLCYNFTNVETFMNLESTRDALHVSEKVETWKSCNNFVNVLFASDWMQDYQEVW